LRPEVEAGLLALLHGSAQYCTTAGNGPSPRGYNKETKKYKLNLCLVVFRVQGAPRDFGWAPLKREDLLTTEKAKEQKVDEIG